MVVFQFWSGQRRSKVELFRGFFGHRSFRLVRDFLHDQPASTCGCYGVDVGVLVVGSSREWLIVVVAGLLRTCTLPH